MARRAALERQLEEMTTLQRDLTVHIANKHTTVRALQMRTSQLKQARHRTTRHRTAPRGTAQLRVLLCARVRAIYNPSSLPYSSLPLHAVLVLVPSARARPPARLPCACLCACVQDCSKSLSMTEDRFVEVLAARARQVEMVSKDFTAFQKIMAKVGVLFRTAAERA